MAELSSGAFVDAPKFNAVTFSPGDLKTTARRLPEAGWLACDGSAVSRTTYSDLFAALVPSLGTFTVTLASPGVFTLAAHGLIVGDALYLTTAGALPTGLAANTQYFVVSMPDANTFTLSASRGGSAINTSGSQSGVHTAWFCPYGLGDGATTFNVPSLRGRVMVAAAGSAGHVDVGALGGNDGVAVAFRRPKHRHTVNVPSGGQLAKTFNGASAGSATSPTQSAGNVTVGADPTNDPLDAPAYEVVNVFVKT